MRRLFVPGFILLFFGFASAIASASCTGAGTAANPYVCTSANGLSRGSTAGAFGGSTIDASSIPAGSRIQSVTITLTMTDGSPEDEYYLLAGPAGGPNDANARNLVFMGGVGGGNSFNGTIHFAEGNPNLPDSAPTNGSTYEPSVRAGTGEPTFSAGAPSTIHYAQPLGATTLSTQFHGANPSGTWTLYGYSAASDGSTATLDSWSISIVLAVGAATSTTVSASPNPVFTSGASSTATMTATVTGTSSNPSIGAVAFTDNGTTISGCESVAVNSSSQATCTKTFNASQEGTHIIAATYTDATGSFGSSTGNTGLQVDNVTTNPAGGQYCNTGIIAVPASVILDFQSSSAGSRTGGTNEIDMRSSS